jgi:hypothetical protein
MEGRNAMFLLHHIVGERKKNIRPIDPGTLSLCRTRMEKKRSMNEKTQKSNLRRDNE